MTVVKPLIAGQISKPQRHTNRLVCLRKLCHVLVQTPAKRFGPPALGY